MADGDEERDEERDVESGATESEPRRMSAMGVEFEPDLEAPLLGTLESMKPQSRVAPLIVLLVFIIVVILLASMMGNLSSRYSQNGQCYAYPFRSTVMWMYAYPESYEIRIRHDEAHGNR